MGSPPGFAPASFPLTPKNPSYTDPTERTPKMRISPSSQLKTAASQTRSESQVPRLTGISLSDASQTRQSELVNGKQDPR